MLEWTYYLILLLLSVAGLVVAVFGLPGIWLMPLGALVYALLTGGRYIGVWGIVALVLLGVIAEILETALGGVAAGKAGGSKRGMLGAVVGGVAGAIVGTGLIPVPVVGTIVGACIGSFGGAYAVEWLWLKRTHGDSLKIGAGAAAGKLAGIITKLVFGFMMLITVGLWALPLGKSPAAPTTAPATLPTTAPTALPATAPTTLPATLPTPTTLPG